LAKKSRGDLGGHEEGLALVGQKLPRGGEGDLQKAHHLPPLPGLDHQHVLALRVLDHGGVGAGGGKLLVGEAPQKGVGVAPHDHLGPHQPPGQLQVLPVAQVGEDDDLVNPLGQKLVDGLLGALVGVQEGHGGPGVGDLLGVRGGEADDPDPLPAHLHYGVRGEEALEPGLGAHVHVGGHHLEPGPLEEVRQGPRPQVKLVVAQGHDPVEHAVHEVAVRQAPVLVEVKGPLEDVPGIQEEEVPTLGPEAVKEGHPLGHAPHPHLLVGKGELHGLQVGVGVVGVDQGEGEPSLGPHEPETAKR
jgi:hypothetical protein